MPSQINLTLDREKIETALWVVQDGQCHLTVPADLLRAALVEGDGGEGIDLARVRMMAEELDAAADTWQDRDDLPEHCRKLARRAREIANALNPKEGQQ